MWSTQSWMRYLYHPLPIMLRDYGGRGSRKTVKLREDHYMSVSSGHDTGFHLWNHSVYGCLHKSCIRSSQTPYQDRWGRGLRSHTPRWGVVGSWWLLGGRESFFFQGCDPWLAAICRQMTLCPCTYLQRYKSLFSIALLIMTRKWMKST